MKLQVTTRAGRYRDERRMSAADFAELTRGAGTGPTTEETQPDVNSRHPRGGRARERSLAAGSSHSPARVNALVTRDPICPGEELPFQSHACS